MAFYETRCIRCGACVKTCLKDLQKVTAEEHQILWDECDHCGKCAVVCPSRALEMIGEWMTIEQIVNAVKRDILYYENSGGGVTFSGGEPTLQPQFLKNCLKRCKNEGVHTALDTCGFVQWSILEEMLPLIDLFLFDIKHMDSDTHKHLTGVRNDLILENLTQIDQYNKSIWIRIPLIPGCNDSMDNLRNTAVFVKKLRNVGKISLLPFNSAAGAKYPCIGQHYGLEGVNLYSNDNENEFLDPFLSLDVEVTLGR